MQSDYLQPMESVLPEPQLFLLKEENCAHRSSRIVGPPTLCPGVSMSLPGKPYLRNGASAGQLRGSSGAETSFQRPRDQLNMQRDKIKLKCLKYLRILGFLEQKKKTNRSISFQSKFLLYSSIYPPIQYFLGAYCMSDSILHAAF